MVAAFTETLLKIARAAGRSLSDQELSRFEAHHRLLKAWGRRMNLTGLKDESMIARRHFLEPIALADLADLLPCRYLTLRAVRADDLLKGKGIRILVPGGKGLFFVTTDEVERLRRHTPFQGLRLSETRPLPSDPRSVLAIFEPGPA